jgi:dTDP-4-dehydrorhamnose reductase
VGAPLVGFSSHLVFDGAKAAPYLESDLPRPLNAYGRSKAEAERLVLASGAQAMMVRTSTLFAGRHMRDFATRLLTSLEDGERPAVACDRFLSPTYAPDLVDAVLDQLIDGELGLRHLANGGRMSWAEFAQGLAVKAGFDADRVRPAPAAEVGWRAPRPVAVALGSEKGQMLPDIHSALDRFGREQRPRRRVAARSRRPDLALAAE